jgi:hypothetical protein
MAPSGVENPGGRSADVGTRGVPLDTVGLGDAVGVGDVVGVGTALLLVIAGVAAVTVPAEVLIGVTVAVGDTDPPTGALPQPARTSPTDVKLDSSIVRVVRRLPKVPLPMSTQ